MDDSEGGERSSPCEEPQHTPSHREKNPLTECEIYNIGAEKENECAIHEGPEASQCGNTRQRSCIDSVLCPFCRVRPGIK
jgi:hypothetical protein